MKASSIIDEMKFDVEHKRACVKAVQSAVASHKTMAGKRWAEGASGLFKSLIEYYGEVEGKRKWASIIRNKRMEAVNLRKKLTLARKELREAKSVLRLALRHL